MHPAAAPTPDTITLCPRRAKWLGILLSCVGFFAIGLITDLRHEWIGIPYDLVWAAGTVICIVQLTPGGSYLRLSREGFVIRSLLRTSSLYRWQDVSEFRVAPIQPRGMLLVVFDCPGRSHPRLANLNRLVAGASHGLPDNYGMSHQALAALMNKWRSQAMR